jgi:hypothetical protein
VTLLRSRWQTACEAQIELTESPAKKKRAALRNRRTTNKPHSGFLFDLVSKKTKASITPAILIALVILVAGASSCKSISERRDNVRPLVMRDVPAQRLAYRIDDKVEAIQLDFQTRRQEDALLRTVRSPDGQRALALYATADAPGPSFRIDLYSSSGTFLRNLIPPDLACVFPETVAWSPEGNFITFIAHKEEKPTPSPTPLIAAPTPETLEASPLPSVAPAFPAVPLFATEQIYTCNRDGYDLKPLTSREGLIYFFLSWAPDSHALVAMACRESEWDAREREYKLPVGRPRLISLEGGERLLDDRLTEALPVWSPDSSKVATAFETDVMIYDAATDKPTQARIRLADALIAASRAYEVKEAEGKKKDDAGEGDSTAGKPAEVIPASFNPIIRLEWTSPETIYLHTAYVRLIPNDPINTFQRWHRLVLSPQAAILR